MLYFPFREPTPNITLAQNRNSNPITASANNSGEGWIQVAFCTALDTFFLPQYPVWVGTPVVNCITDQNGNCVGETPTCTNKSNGYFPSPYLTGTTYAWNLNPLSNNQVWTYGSEGWVYLLTPGYIGLSVYGTNACGSGPTFTTHIIGATCTSSSYSLSPNPASNSVTLTKTIVSDTTVLTKPTALLAAASSNTSSAVTLYTIKIVSSTGITYYSNKVSADALTIPINNLPNGTYVVEITDGLNVVNKQLIVKH